jgi:hypothetical protein
MALIQNLIPAQAYQIILARIVEILIEEVENQQDLAGADFAVRTFSPERSTPYEAKDLPAINVQLAEGNYPTKDVTQADGVYEYYIDVWTSAKSTTEDRGDKLATYLAHRIAGVVRAILENPQYRTLATTAGYIRRTKVDSIKMIRIDPNDLQNMCMARITFIVEAPESVELKECVDIAGYQTRVQIAASAEGYLWSADAEPFNFCENFVMTLTEAQLECLRIDAVDGGGPGTDYDPIYGLLNLPLIQIQLRRGTAASWATNNPVLAAGEEGHETDTGRRKVGDGETAWNDLAYFGLENLKDVEFTDVQDNDFLYRRDGRWVNEPVTFVLSYNARTGHVTSQAGDYDTSMVTENGNLYWTQGRFDTALAAKNLDGRYLQLSGGTMTGSILYANNMGLDSASAGFNLTIGATNANTITIGRSASTINLLNLVGVGEASPTARLQVRGTTANNTANALLIRNSTPAALFTIRNDGRLTLSNALRIDTESNGSMSLSGGEILFVALNAPATTATGIVSQYRFSTNVSWSHTLENRYFMIIGGVDYTVSSGTGTVSMLRVMGTFNQTGTATGAITGVKIDPIITAAYDYRALESTDGKVILGGTSKHCYLVTHRLTTAQRDALTNLVNGAVIYNTDTGKHQGYNGAWNDLY